MKKKHFLFSLFLLLLFQQCHDPESVKPASTGQILQEIKEWYGKGLSTNGTSLTSKAGFTSIGLWDKAKTYKGKSNDKYAVIVPLEAYSQKQFQSEFKLIAFRDKQKIQGFILQLIPDKDYLLKKYQTGDQLAFSGQIKIKSKTGKQMKTFLFKDGKPKPFIKAAASFRTMDEGEEDVPEIDSDATMLDDEVVAIGYQYDFSDFNYLWLDGNTLGSTWTDNDNASFLYSDVNNDGQIDVAIPIDKDAGISCASFSFVSTTSNWQESAVKGIGFTVKYIDAATNTSFTKEMKIARAIWFGLPMKKSSNEVISPGQAAEISAEAVQYASDLTHLLYIENPYTPISTAESVFMGFLKSKLLEDGGRGDFYGSGSSKVIPTTAYYNWLGNGDCD